MQPGGCDCYYFENLTWSGEEKQTPKMVACPMRKARGFVRQKQTDGKIFLKLFCDERAASQYLQRRKTRDAEEKRAAWANSHTHPDREAAAVESETEQFVIGIPIAAGRRVCRGRLRCSAGRHQTHHCDSPAV